MACPCDGMWFSINRNEELAHALVWMNLEPSGSVKEACHRRLHGVGFRLQEMSGIGRGDKWLPGPEGKGNGQ